MALVRNKAKLAYGAVAAWLDGQAPPPPLMERADGVAEQIRLQDETARALRQKRHELGALRLETLEPRARLQDGMMRDLVVEPKNRAHDLIEDFMVAANTVTTRFLSARGFSTFRRVVRRPERWDRIRAVAAELGDELPDKPDSRALNEFLRRRRRADPLRFPDLSVTVVKLIGSGEYVVHQPDDAPIGHFGLAVRDYTHSTAPNRRYPDIITQRLLKCAVENRPSLYSNSTLRHLARHCTDQEDVVRKVERQVLKSAGALLLESRIGDVFDGVVTGAGDKGTWVRLLRPPVEGKLVEGLGGLDVGDQVTVRLVSVDVDRGFIDLAAAGRGPGRR
jgi:exoribonuclease-2